MSSAPRNTWTSHIAYRSVISLLGQWLRTSKCSPVPGAWQRFLAILSLVFCYAIHLGSTENINKRSPGAPASYYFCQNEILDSERVNGLLSKFIYIYILQKFVLFSLWGRKCFHFATIKLCTSCSQTADRKAWSLKSEIKYHFCWGVKKVFFNWFEWTLPSHATHCLASCLKVHKHEIILNFFWPKSNP